MPVARNLPDGVLSIGKIKTKSGRLEYSFSVPCIKCGVFRVVKRRQHAIGMAGKPCKRCSNVSNHPIGYEGKIRLSFFNKYKIHALQRNKEWAIDAEYAAKVLENQGFKCVLTGVSIDAAGKLDQMTASLDRIDNSMGYVAGNIQWVHKDVNMMRGSLTIDRFMEVCRLVVQQTDEPRKMVNFFP